MASDAPEMVVERVARRLHRRFVVQGACYQTALFLKYHLETVFMIPTEAVIGYVNDGTDDLHSSHAWIEHNGLVTDIALSRTMEPRIQKAGAVIIQGRVVQPGWHYSYSRSRPAGTFAVAAYDGLHSGMVSIVGDLAAIRTYLDGAPDGLDYRRLAALVR